MKQRFGFVSNSSSCSFTCVLTAKTTCGYDWDDPIDHNMYECETCRKSFSIKALKELGILVYPNKEGYIRKHDCPICKGWKIERIILKPGETYKIIRDEEI